jgi:3-oxoadipate enol-lactonase
MPTAQTGDITTYYEESGSGDPLILICGLSADVQVWRFLVPVLSRRYRVICYDNRGAGRTDAPDKPYSMAGMASDLAALMDHLEIGSAHIAGWSMGGVIAQAFALARPDRVRKLVLISTLARPTGQFRVGVRTWMNIRRSNMPFEQVMRYVSLGLYTPAFYDDEARYEKVIQFMVTNPYAQKQHAFLRQAEALIANDPGDAARNIRSPTLVLLGRYDTRVPPHLSEHLAQLIKNATQKVTNSGHAGFVEFPDEYGAAIVEFLE